MSKSKKEQTEKITPEQKICEKHGVPFIEISLGFYEKNILDEYGNIIDTKEMEATQEVCPECDYEKDEQEMEKYNVSDFPEDVEKGIQKYEQSHPKIESPNAPDFISIYAPFISDRYSTPLFVGEAACEFLISSALKNAGYATNKGRVLSNLAFRHLAETGHNKSPLFKYLSLIVIPEAFESYEYHKIGRGTGRKILLQRQQWKGNLQRHNFLQSQE